MRVSHCHRQTLVPQYSLKGQDVAATHHEVARKGVTQGVRQPVFPSLSLVLLIAIRRILLARNS